MGLWLRMSRSAHRGRPLHTPDMAPVQPVMSRLTPLLPKDPMVRLEGEGAGNVYVNLTRNRDFFTIQLINYAAELHPDLDEAKQQETDRSIPARGLRLLVRLPADVSPNAEAAQVRTPEAQRQVQVQVQDGVVSLSIDRLDQYMAVMLPL